MYHEYTQEKLRSYCKSNIETMEIWARRLIHEKMTNQYGENYIDANLNANEKLIKKEIRDHVNNMMRNEPERFSRPVDTLFLDHIIYFLCNKKWYEILFKEALDYAYPQGCEEAREFLSRLIPIRNSLSHSNHISLYQAERAICYSHDFIEGLKQYYKNKGEEKMWNVPRIIRVSDSLGNVYENLIEKRTAGVTQRIPQEMNCGDSYSIDIEIDSAFAQNEYEIFWTSSRRDLDEKYRNSKHAVKGMLPKNKLAADRLKRLRVFAGAEHTHAAQNPKEIK